METISNALGSGATGAPARWRAAALGSHRRIRLAQGFLNYWEAGEGQPLVFVHGWLVNANLWRKVVPGLAHRFRCITIDMPLGSHLEGLDPEADLTPDGCGALVADFLDALALQDVSLVGNDSGGAYSQIAVSLGRGRVSRLILTNCETPYDPFPPPAFDSLVKAAESPDTLRRLLGNLQNAQVRASAAGYGGLCKLGLPGDAAESYVLPSMHDDAVLHDASKAMRSAHQRHVAAAGRRLTANFKAPVRFIWATECPFFSFDSAVRYAAELADGKIEAIDDAFSFLPEDQPQQLAAAIERALPFIAQAETI